MGKRKQTRRATIAAPARQWHDDEGMQIRLWAIAIAALAVFVYANAFGHDFVLDDTRLIRDNVRIRSLADVPHLFADSYWGTEGTQALYRPLPLATYAVNYAMHGLSTAGYTAVNVLLHVAVSLLLFALVRAMGAPVFAAGTAGVLFAVHPVHTEAVTGISGRPELLAACFCLLALHLYRRAPGAGRTALRYRAGALICFACALLSKESAITLLAVFPAMDALVPARAGDGQPAGPRSRFLSDYLPIAIVAVAYLVVRRAVLGGIVIPGSGIAPLDNPLVPVTVTPTGDSMGATEGQALMTAFAVVAEYARLLVWPARLSPDYSYNQIPLVTSALDVRFLLGVAIVMACAGAVVWLWRRSPVATFGLVFLALTYSIAGNFVIRIGTICAERLVYLPSAGALIAAGVALERVVGRTARPRRALIMVLAAVVVAASVRTMVRNQDWRDESTLWTAAVKVAPASARVQSEYGRIVMARAETAAADRRTGDAERLYGEAQAHFETAVTIYPSYSLPLDGLAMIASLHDRFDEADALYARAMKAWPGNFSSLANWGSLQWERSKRIGAQAMALRRDGKIAESDALVRRADEGFRQAQNTIDRAVAMNPAYAQAHLVRAQILATYAGDVNGALAEFETVLRLEPNHPQRLLIETEMQRLRVRERAR